MKQRDIIINQRTLRDYILFILIGGCLSVYIYDITAGFSSRTAAVTGYAVVLASALVLLCLYAVFAPFSFNGKEFNYRYKRICRSSEIIKQIRAFNEEYEQKIKDSVLEIEYVYSSQEEYDSLDAKMYMKRVLSEAELKERIEIRDQFQMQYDSRFSQLVCLTEGREKELADTMHVLWNYEPIATLLIKPVQAEDRFAFSWERKDYFVEDLAENDTDLRNDESISESIDVTIPEGFYELEQWLTERAFMCQYTGVYVLKNLENGKCYVGQAKNIKKRVLQHKSGNGCRELYEDYMKGDRIVVFSQSLIKSGYNNLDQFEKDMIRKYHAYSNGYNKNTGNDI